jgi:hypothetical protein
MQEKLKKLFEVVSEAERIELTTLHNAMVSNHRNYREDPTVANKKHWDAAKAGLDQETNRLWQKYFAQQIDNHQVFKNRSAVVQWLIDKGYKVKKSKVYKDAKAGLLRIEEDGTVLMESVRRYLAHPEAGVKEHMETVDAGSDIEIKEYHRRAAIAKAKKTELEARRIEFEMEKEEGRWIPREDLELEMAGRAAVLEQGFRNLVQVRAADWIHICGGDAARAGELRAAVNEQLDDLLNEFARADVFQVLFEEGA